MVGVELVTIPGCGTRSVERWIKEPVVHYPFPVSKRSTGEKRDQTKQALSMGTMVSTHLQLSDPVAFDRIMRLENTVFLTTWRDPLRTVIHNLFKGRIWIMKSFEMLQFLRQQRTVLIIDLDMIPYHEGAGEVDTPADFVEGTGLREAYFAKDLPAVAEIIPDYLHQLREFDWGDLWTEGWWN